MIAILEPSQVPFSDKQFLVGSAACKYRATRPFIRSTCFQANSCLNQTLCIPTLPGTRPTPLDCGGGHLLTSSIYVTRGSQAESMEGEANTAPPRKRNLSMGPTISSCVGSLSKIFMGGGSGVCDSSSGSSSPQPFLLF